VITSKRGEGSDMRHRAVLIDAGMLIEEQFGDWDRQPLTDTCPEIITIARLG
jgi:hypothetical protein